MPNAFRVRELGTPSKFMLYDRTPKIDFAADAALCVADLPQVLTILRRINTACASPMRDVVGSFRHMASSGCNAAPRLKGQIPSPRLAIQGFQSRFIPAPNPIADNGRDTNRDRLAA